MEKSINQIRVTKALLELGINPSHKGFNYLRDAIILVYKDPTLVHNAVTKSLYPDVAAMNDTTKTRVERAIRHSIEVAFNNTPMEVFQEYFGNCVSCLSGKLTNSTFIAGVVKVLEMQDEEGNANEDS